MGRTGRARALRGRPLDDPTDQEARRACADDGLGTVLVTGGASGLGAAIAAAVAAEGGTPRRARPAAAGDGFAFGAVDLATPARGRGRRPRDRRGARRADAVVTAAGIDACGDILDVDADAWDRVVAVNLLGTAAVVRAALP